MATQKEFITRIKELKNTSTYSLQKKLIDTTIKNNLSISDICCCLCLDKSTVQRWFASEKRYYFRLIDKTILATLCLKIKFARLILK